MSRKRRSKQNASAGKTATPIATEAASSAHWPQFHPRTLAGFAVLLAALTAILYSPIANHPFLTYDDDDYIAANPNIQNGVNFATVKWAVIAAYRANWHPVTWIVHAADFQLYGMDAGGHHVTSLLFHSANVVLLFLLLAVATRAVGRSFIVAALFALHPLNVESVAWAAELKTVLSGFFFFLALAAYGWYARKPAAGKYVAIFLLLALGLAAKAMVITLPFLLLLIDFWPLGRVRGLTQPSLTFPVPQTTWLHLVLEKLPLLALSAVDAWLTVRAQKAGLAMNLVHASLGARIANALVSYATYIEKALLPTGLAPFYPFPTHVIAWKVAISVVVLAAITAVVIRFGRMQHYLVTGWLWFLGSLVPMLGILQVGGQSHADRYMYVPMVGLWVMMVWGLSAIADAKQISFNARTVPALALIAIFAALTLRQISFWGSNYSLWAHTLAVTSNNSIAEHNLTTELIRERRFDEAAPHLLRNVELDPDDLVSRVNLGSIYYREGKNQQALDEFLAVVRKSHDPKILFPASVDAGQTYQRLGDFANAEAAYRLALRIYPDNPSAIQGLNSLHQQEAANMQSLAPSSN